MYYLVWALVLILLAAILIFLEVFLPTLGTLGSMAVVCVIAATFVAYKAAEIWGAVGILALAGIVVPATIAFALYLFPRTPLGSMLLDQADPTRELEEERAGLKLLVGEKGIVKSKMLPSGAVQIRTRTFDALSEGGAIEAGQMVVVIAIKMNRLVVRPLDAEPVAAEAAPSSTSKPTREDDPLSRPFEELGIDPIEPLS